MDYQSLLLGASKLGMILSGGSILFYSGGYLIGKAIKDKNEYDKYIRPLKDKIILFPFKHGIKDGFEENHPNTE